MRRLPERTPCAYGRECPLLADSGLMHRSIKVRCRKARLNGKNRPEAVFADFKSMLCRPGKADICVQAQPRRHCVGCSPTLSGGYSCYNYDTGAFSDITPRFGYEVYGYGGGAIGVEPPRHEGHQDYDGYGIPRIEGQYETFNYDTGEIGIITPKLGGGFRIDTY